MCFSGKASSQALDLKARADWRRGWQGGHALRARAGAAALDQAYEPLYARLCQLLQVRLAILYEGLEGLLHYRIGQQRAEEAQHCAADAHSTLI